MKHIKKYYLFCEANEPETVMDNITSDIDFSKIDQSNAEIEKLKEKIEAKKTELEKNLELLQNLQVDGFTEDNKEKIEIKKKQIETDIETVKIEIKSIEDTIKIFKDKIDSLK